MVTYAQMIDPDFRSSDRVTLNTLKEWIEDYHNSTHAVRTVTESGSFLATDVTIVVSSAVVVNTTHTLPTIGSVPAGWIYSLKKRNADGVDVTLGGNGSTIDGEASVTLTAENESIMVKNAVTEWIKIAEVGGGGMTVHAIDGILNDAVTVITSDPINIESATKVGIIFKSTVTKVGSAPQVTYTVEVSGNDTQWDVCDLIMTSGGESLPAASIVHDETAAEAAYLAHGFAAKSIRIVATGLNVDADDTVDSDVWVTVKK